MNCLMQVCSRLHCHAIILYILGTLHYIALVFYMYSLLYSVSYVFPSPVPISCFFRYRTSRKKPKIIITTPVFTWENTICTFVKDMAYTDHGPLNNVFSKWVIELGICWTKDSNFDVCQPVNMYFFMGYNDLGWLYLYFPACEYIMFSSLLLLKCWRGTGWASLWYHECVMFWYR